MTLTVRHATAYAFDRPVFLEPHVIRLHPRCGAAARLLDFALDIDPAPALRADNLDIDGNVVTHAWFEGLTEALTVRARATVETLVHDPFRFLVLDPHRALPCVYPADAARRLAPCLAAPEAADPAVQALAEDVARASSHDALAFPVDLARRIHADFARERRLEGPPLAPAETLARGGGACRDLAVLFVACCRAMGLAARFASGYAYTEDDAPNDLHAWAEVYLMGGGWRAYDPTHGLAVADRHVTLAAAPDADGAAPVSGAFRGGATARLHVEVDVRAPGVG